MPTYIGSPASSTTTLSSAGCAELVDLAGHDAEQGVVTGGEPRDTHRQSTLPVAAGRVRGDASSRWSPTGARRRRSTCDGAGGHVHGGPARRASSASSTPHLGRRARGRDSTPVHDFLFTYYSSGRRSCGAGTPGSASRSRAPAERTPRGWRTRASPTRRRVVGTDRGHVSAESQRAAASARRLHALLTATAARPAQLRLLRAARVGDGPPAQRRDPARRLAAAPRPAGTDAVVESHRVACSHFDAFRFFTPSARPLNTLQPGRDDRPAYEQPGCLHANMDLYKHAFRLSPLVRRELVADCFALARDIRVLDMRASPYDLADLGFEPVRIETAEGKQEYAAAQRAFAERAAPLRARLIEAVDAVRR